MAASVRLSRMVWQITCHLHCGPKRSRCRIISLPVLGRVDARFRNSPAPTSPTIHAHPTAGNTEAATTSRAWTMPDAPCSRRSRSAPRFASARCIGCKAKAMVAPRAASCPRDGMRSCRARKDPRGIAINSSPIASSGRLIFVRSQVRAVNCRCSSIKP